MSSAVSKDWRSNARSLLRWLPGVVITFLAIWLLSRLVDWDKFISALVSIPPWILLITILVYLFSILLRALVWQFLLQRKVSVKQAFLALNEGYFFNNVLPFRLGELARAFLLGRRSNLGMFHVLSTIVVERSYDLVIAASLLLITLSMALKMEWAQSVVVVLLLAILAGLVALYLAARNSQWVESRVERLAGRWGIVRRWVLPQIHSVLAGFSVLTRPQYFAASFGFMAFIWFISILRDWMLIRVFVPQAPMWWAALGISAANIAGAVPSVMAALGTYEAGATGALSLVGMPAEAALAYALVMHVIHLIFSSLIGALALTMEGQTLSRLITEIRSVRVGDSKT